MNWYSNLDAKPRLILAFALVLVLTLGIGVLGIFQLNAANLRMKQNARDMQVFAAMQNSAYHRADLARQVRDAVMNSDRPDIVAADANALEKDTKLLRKDLDDAESAAYTDEVKALLQQVADVQVRYEKGVEGELAAVRAGDLVLVKQRTNGMNDVATEMAATVNRVRDYASKLSQEKSETNEKAYASARNLIVIALAVALLLGIGLAYFIARVFSTALQSAGEALNNLATGDLTASLDIDTRDEIGRMAEALNSAVGHLHTTMRDVATTAEETKSSSQQLASASEAIASGAQEQAASLEETSASLEQITATVRNTADNARQASQFAASSAQAAVEGQEVVAKAIVAMSEIDASSAKISEIISTIDEIAFQTNLLAVNAAVEAARAGEEGRGFAVVASEVRSLAQRSGVAAKEIKTLIQDSVRKVEIGSSLVNRSGETLRGIVTSVKKVTDIVSEIATASAEQSTGIEQVNTAMTQMDQVTQSNSAQTEELSATAQSLSHQAEHLAQLIQRFRLASEEEQSSGGHSRGFASRGSSARSHLGRAARSGANSQPSRIPAFTAVAAGPSAMEAGFEEF